MCLVDESILHSFQLCYHCPPSLKMELVHRYSYLFTIVNSAGLSEISVHGMQLRRSDLHACTTVDYHLLSWWLQY